MDRESFIKIDQKKCIGCLQCLRSCDVHAIRYVGGHLNIEQERCVKCGVCQQACTYKAVIIDPAIDQVRSLIEHNDVVIASVSPTWVSEFRGVTMNQFVLGLKKLGFTHVSQATHGAARVIEITKENIKNHPSPLMISSICPVVNKLIEAYYPQHLDNMNPISMPETLHCRMLKEIYGQSAKVIYFSSCVASKANCVLDGAVTYSSLRDWFISQKIDLHTFEANGDNHFEPSLANDYHGYQLISSAINYFPDVDVQSASGLARVMKMLEDINVGDIEDKIYLELFACAGGCLTSVGSIDKNNMLAKKLRFDKHVRDGKTSIKATLPQVEHHIKRVDRGMNRFATEQQKEQILRRMNISLSGSLLNCAACGYHTCDQFANAVVLGMAEVRTCVWHQMNSISNNIATMVEQIPYSAFIVNRKKKITFANTQFASVIGIDLKMLLSGKIVLGKMLSFSDEIEQMLVSGDEVRYHDVIINSISLKLQLTLLPSGTSVLCTLKNDMTESSFGDQYVESVREVVRSNIASIQQIANLLGENVSRTESLLSSIVDNKDYVNK